MKTQWSLLLITGVLLWGCSSAPEVQPEPSKKEIRQDADGFFKKMKQEEELGKTGSSQ